MISYVPYFLHEHIFGECLKQKKNVVHASYNKQFSKYDALCKEAGITILGEVGVDPGIDHMSALKFLE